MLLGNDNTLANYVLELSFRNVVNLHSNTMNLALQRDLKISPMKTRDVRYQCCSKTKCTVRKVAYKRFQKFAFHELLDKQYFTSLDDSWNLSYSSLLMSFQKFKIRTCTYHVPALVPCIGMMRVPGNIGQNHPFIFPKPLSVSKLSTLFTQLTFVLRLCDHSFWQLFCALFNQKIAFYLKIRWLPMMKLIFSMVSNYCLFLQDVKTVYCCKQGLGAVQEAFHTAMDHFVQVSWSLCFNC